MNYGFLMQQRLERFKEILNILPKPEEIPAELLVISTGKMPGRWSYRHIETPGETIYFIFKKAGFAEAQAAAWECVDRDLNEVMQTHLQTAN